MDSFFKQRFNASKCKTLLKLSIPRIKLLRNRREHQLKQMRRDIAKLLETGQEATARIRVEHIIREEKMMAAQEIVELFCELVSVRLPIIEAQRECPLDLKEAISSICFAAPRCADLPELQQVQLLFAGKYGKEFVAAATELMPDCGVNRQLIELLSIRAPAPDVKVKLLKEIAEEHELDWDPTPSQTELLKPHEDLLNGPTQFVSASQFPFPGEKDDEKITAPQPATQEYMYGQTNVGISKFPPPNEKVDEAITTAQPATQEQSDSDEDFDMVDFPEVPKQPLHMNKGTVSAPEMLPFPANAFSDDDDQEERNPSEFKENLPQLRSEHLEQKKSFTTEDLSKMSVGPVEAKQFLPFMSTPSQSQESFSAREQHDSPPSASTIRVNNLDLQDVLAAAQAAADSAERAATAARSAASLAQLRISELVNKNNDADSPTGENPFHVSGSKPDVSGREGLDKQNSFSASGSPLTATIQHNGNLSQTTDQPTVYPSYDDSSPHGSHGVNSHHQPQRLPSMDDDYFSYPNLFNSQGSNLSRPGSFKDSK